MPSNHRIDVTRAATADWFNQLQRTLLRQNEVLGCPKWLCGEITPKAENGMAHERRKPALGLPTILPELRPATSVIRA